MLSNDKSNNTDILTRYYFYINILHKNKYHTIYCEMKDLRQKPTHYKIITDRISDKFNTIIRDNKNISINDIITSLKSIKTQYLSKIYRNSLTTSKIIYQDTITSSIFFSTIDNKKNIIENIDNFFSKKSKHSSVVHLTLLDLKLGYFEKYRFKLHDIKFNIFKKNARQSLLSNQNLQHLLKNHWCDDVKIFKIKITNFYKKNDCKNQVVLVI